MNRKVAANASEEEAMSYQRMQEEEQRLATEVEALLVKADATGRCEDEHAGFGQAAEDLPEEL